MTAVNSCVIIKEILDSFFRFALRGDLTQHAVFTSMGGFSLTADLKTISGWLD